MALVRDTIVRARHQLQDEDPVAYRWSDPELIDYVNDGLRQTVILKPEANVVEEVFTPGPGVFQRLPDAAIKFMSVKANINSATGLPSNAVQYCDKNVFDTYAPNWVSSPPGEVQNYMHDPRDPLGFYIFPASSNDLLVEYAALPVEVAEQEDTLPLRDQYINAIVQYVLYRALTKEGRFSQNPENKRTQLWQAFMQELGLSRAVAQSMGPVAREAAE